jgi:N-acyl homoserine lactone hydrolase
MHCNELMTLLRRVYCLGMAVFAAVMVLALPTGAATTAPDIQLWRLDCGEFPDFDIAQMSDTFAYPRRVKTLANSCYLVRHNNEYMLWDTGFSSKTIKAFNGAVTMRETLVDQLSTIGVDPRQVLIVGISHSHPDHTGQAAQFPKGRLLMGKADFDFLAQDNSEDIAPWLTDKAILEKVSGDKDVFGDGSVVMLATPGHTMGHYSLLIRLHKFGPVILSGDLWHCREQVSHNGVPPEIVDRAATLASMDRILKAATNLKARIIIQHEKLDIPKLPLFPASAH